MFHSERLGHLLSQLVPNSSTFSIPCFSKHSLMDTSRFTSIPRKVVHKVRAPILINLVALFSISPALAFPAWMVTVGYPLKGDEFGRSRNFTAEHIAFSWIITIGSLSVTFSLDRGWLAPGQDVCKAIIVPDLNRGFVTNGDTGNVTVFDLKTLESRGTIKAHPDADAICYEPATRRIFTFNGDSHSSTVIDPEHTTVIGTLPLDGSPESAEADGHGAVFVSISDKDEVQKIDAAESKVVQRWPLPAQAKPVTIALDQQRERIFVGCRNQTLLVLDSTSGKEVASLKIGKWVDDTVYDAVRRRIFVCCGDGTLTVIRQDSPDSYKVEEVVPTSQVFTP